MISTISVRNSAVHTQIQQRAVVQADDNKQRNDEQQQLDMMDCGAACLQSISKYYGKYFSQQRLRHLCHKGIMFASRFGFLKIAGYKS